MGKSSPTYNPGDGLTLEEAEVVALFYNPRLRAARIQAQVPVLSATEAGRWDDPELGGEAMRILDQEVEKPWILGSSLSFTIPVSGRLGVEKTKATAEGHAALVGAWGIEQELLHELRQGWIAWESASRSAATSRTLLSRLDEVVSITERLEKAGELIAVEGVAFRLEQARARLDLTEVEVREAESRRTLLALMGLMPGAEVRLVPSERTSPQQAIPDAEGLMARNPTVALRRAEYEVAEQGLRLEVRRQYPDVQLGPAYANEEGVDQLGIGFSIPIPILNANKHGIVEAQANREAARVAWEESVQEALSGLAAAQARLAASEQRHAAIRTGIVPLAESQLGSARHLAEQGEVNTLLLLEALSSQREAELDLIAAEEQVALSRVAIKALAPAEPPQPGAAK